MVLELLSLTTKGWSDQAHGPLAVPQLLLGSTWHPALSLWLGQRNASQEAS